jgi:hypothetical protein
MPIVITVQSDGPLNFDKPAPICFPIYRPGDKTNVAGRQQAELILLNHKKGIWKALAQ